MWRRRGSWTIGGGDQGGEDDGNGLIIDIDSCCFSTNIECTGVDEDGERRFYQKMEHPRVVYGVQ